VISRRGGGAGREGRRGEKEEEREMGWGGRRYKETGRGREGGTHGTEEKVGTRITGGDTGHWEIEKGYRRGGRE